VIPRETLDRLAAETGERLAELGVRASDGAWIRRHAEAIASLASVSKRSLAARLYRLARAAARAAK
jgi:hypothetical protein